MMAATRLLNQLFKNVSKQSYVRTLLTEVPFTDVTLKEPLHVKGRQWLAGVNGANMPHQIDYGNAPEAKAFVLENKHAGNIHDLSDSIKNIVETSFPSFSALVFKDLPLDTAKDFAELMNGVGYPRVNYLSGAAFRTDHGDNVYDASLEPPAFTIEPHNEMAYHVTFPSQFWLFGLSEGTWGGESLICFNRDLIDMVDPEVIEKIARKKIHYIRNYGDQNVNPYFPWQVALKTDNKQEAERKVEAQNFEWQWNDNGSLSIWNKVEAVVKHPITNEVIWFNQLQQHHGTFCHYHPDFANIDFDDPAFVYPFDVKYGDGEEVEPEVVQHLRDCTWRSTAALTLKKGDLLVLDNVLCQHGRMAFEGPRHLLVALTNEKMRSDYNLNHDELEHWLSTRKPKNTSYA